MTMAERVAAVRDGGGRTGAAAVLMVELASRQVVHVNAIAEELAPGVSLPVGLDVWSDVAELRDIDGTELSATDHPLSRAARSEPVDGQAVTAARRSGLGERREPLWLVAVPMIGAPMLEDHVLVVLLPHVAPSDDRPTPDEVPPLSDEVDGLEMAQIGAATGVDGLGNGDAGRELRDRALAATTLSFTVADALADDQPLVWVNPAFTATTGYEFDEVVGQNCRFLQGDDTDEIGPGQLRHAIERGVPTRVTLLNYRKDGTSFWNQVDLSPVHDAQGTIAHIVGIQTDVTDQVEAAQATRAALEAEREARADAEATRTRLTFLVDAVNRLSGSLDVAGCADELLSLVVPYLADWALLLHDDDVAPLSLMRARHRDPRRQEEVDAFAAFLPRALRPGPVADVLLGDRPYRVIDDLDSASSHDERGGYLRDDALIARTAALGGRQALVVGLVGRAGVHDVLVLVRAVGRADFDDDDITAALDLGRRVGLILDNASLYEGQARIAKVLQRSLLPELPDVPGIEAVSRYVADETRAEVGGDFYELFDFAGNDDSAAELRGRGAGFAIGDVIGHDILAAAAMGRIQGMLRAAARERPDEPARVLENVDALMLDIGHASMTTAVFAHLVPSGPGWRLRWSSAGHPPLAVLRPDGVAEVLHVRNDLLLGVKNVDRVEHEVDLPHGTIVVAYTDGLVERRTEVIDVGLDRLRTTLQDLPRGVEGRPDLAAVSDGLIDVLSGPGRTDDDIALLVLRLDDPEQVTGA
ncbi:SpoIIE family protein phosphatase [Nocardioides sp. C4-1]|uniref:SpoIIE family protein phosphatase n=1 Tax=Nocardioides sp. C4-1 TaxID=3151851 RepID=UPI003263CC24